MRAPVEVSLPVFADPTGTLVPVEDADAGFAVRRVFSVTGVPGGSRRGGHRPGCRELLVLVGGRCEVSVDRSSGSHTEHLLDRPGDAVHVGPEDLVAYTLADEHAAIMVLCDAPYGRRA